MKIWPLTDWGRVRGQRGLYPGRSGKMVSCQGKSLGGQSIRHHGYSFLGTGYSTRLQQGFLRNDTRAEFPKELNVKHARVISVSVSEEGEVTTVHRWSQHEPNNRKDQFILGIFQPVSIGKAQESFLCMALCLTHPSSHLGRLFPSNTACLG